MALSHVYTLIVDRYGGGGSAGGKGRLRVEVSIGRRNTCHSAKFISNLNPMAAHHLEADPKKPRG